MNTIRFEKGSVRMVAHRGLSGLETENTNAAFVAAGNRSYYGIETDIHRTADGRFVIVHDSSLARVGGEPIPVEEVTLATLQGILLFDRDGTKDRADLRVGTLENYVDLCKKYEKHCVLELKSLFTEEEIDRILEILRARDYLDNTTFISFKFDNLVKIRERLPEHSVQYLFSEVTEEVMEQVRTYRFDVDVKYTSLTPEVIRDFRALGCKVNCWTVNTREDGERLAAMGVDFITTNILE